MSRSLLALLGALSFAVLLAGCGGGSGGSSLPPTAANPGTSTTSAGTANTGAGTSTTTATTTGTISTMSAGDAQRVLASLAAAQRPDGAIIYTSTEVMPYFANIAAIGAAHVGASGVNVRAYMQWYIARTHDPNPWGIAGAITDYKIKADGTLKAKNSADSVDSYAATFLTLAATAWRHGDATTRAYVQTIRSDVERIASAIDAVTDGDGLTWALPTYRVKYVMDASEVYDGLNGLAILRSEAYGDGSGAATAAQRAATLRAKILATYWQPATSTFATALDDGGALEEPSPTNWYDSMTQLWPILHGVIEPSSPPAQAVYAAFNASFPAWTALVKPDEYPWASVAVIALQMNDTPRAVAYRAAADAQFAPAYAYPWYCAESGFYLRALSAMSAPQTVAQL